MGWPSPQGILDNVAAYYLILLLEAVGAYMLTRWLKRYYYNSSPPVLVITGISIYALLMFAWNQTVAFRERGDRATSEFSPQSKSLSRPAHTLATPCQLRLSPSERDKILKFLRENASQRQRVKKIEIVVEQGRKDDCLYAEDLRNVFHDLGLWGSAEIVEEIPPEKKVHGKAVWFENSLDDELARTFWKQTLCYLGQEFYHEGQADVASSKWMFFIRDREGGAEPYSPEVICPNKLPAHEIPSYSGE